MKLFNNVAHFFATLFKGAAKAIPAIEATQPVVTAITTAAAGPVYGPLAATLEDAGYAVLGELASVLTAGGAAASAKLVDAGLDIKVIQTVQAVVAGVPAVVAAAKAL